MRSGSTFFAVATGSILALQLLLPACGSSGGSSGNGPLSGSSSGGGSGSGSGSGSSGGSSGGFPGDDGGSITDGAGRSDGANESGGPPEFVSDLPGATVVDVGTPPTPNLVLISLNFLQQPSGGMFYQLWLGEVENVGTSVVCTVSVDLTLKDSGGNVVVQPRTSYVDAAPYTLQGSTLTSACLGAGSIGSFYVNGFANTMADTSTVKTIEVKFGPGSLTAIAPDPNAPLVTAMPVPYIGAYALQGTLTGENGTINNISLHVYPRDATGLVLGQITATDLNDLTPGSTFSFTTDTVPQSFSEYRAYANYIEGP
jgi:hypothetical protein